MAEIPADGRHHVESMLMRESLLDKRVMSATETPVVRMLPFCGVLKVGGRSIIDRGKSATYPLVDAIVAALAKFKLVIATGGGIRSRHVTSIGMDLGLPTGVLAQLRIIDALGNAHLLGTLLAPHGVVAIPPEILGHMLPFFIKDISVTELKARNLPTLPFDRVLIDLLACARQVKQFQIINGLKPHLLEPALRGEHVGTIVRKDAAG